MTNWLRGVLGVSALAVLLSSAPVRAQDEGKTKFEVYQDRKSEWRWRFKAANGAILATHGDGYKAKADCLKGIESIKNNIGSKMKVEFYTDKKDQHRWRLKASNGNIMAVSSEGYKAKADAEKAFDTLKKEAKSAQVVEQKAEK